MKILAVEFSSEHRGVAVVDAASGALLGQAVEQGGRCAIELADRALAAAGCEREEIGIVAVGLGPGSYTGIRGAISLAQGWQLGREVKLLGLSSVECMARALADAGQSQTVHIVIDAQRNEFYVAKYELSANLYREVEVLKLVPAEQVQRLCLAGERVLGPEVAARFSGAQDLYPQAPVLGRLAVGRADFVAGEKLEPIYLRQADFKKAPPSRIIS